MTIFTWKLFRLSVVMIIATTLGSACGERPGPQSSRDDVAPDSRPSVNRLPVSLNTVMVALVNQAADPLWVAAWRNPQTEKEWRELERRAVQLQLGGALLRLPGTGPMDATWTSNDVWQKWASELHNVGTDAVIAVKARDVDQISGVGDRIVEICEGCHIDYKPATPTGGEYGELSPTPE